MHPYIQTHKDKINFICILFGLLAQLVERFHGMEEVAGSNPVQSTTINRPVGGFVLAVHLVLVRCTILMINNSTTQYE